MTRAPIFACLLLLGGCISLLPDPPPPPRMFALEARDVQQVGGAPVDAVIAVATPSGERAILGIDLVWRTGDRLAFVDQTQWSTRAEFALQTMLVETLIHQGRFRAATRAGEANASYEVRWEVLDFEVRAEEMMARFVAEVRIVASPGRRIVASTIVTAEAPVADRSSTAAAQALARAAREGSARIAVFAADTASAAAADQANAASISR